GQILSKSYDEIEALLNLMLVRSQDYQDSGRGFIVAKVPEKLEVDGFYTPGNQGSDPK
ncbi:hypothetical protein HAX54_046084, partial [Datura stramonium]|nr:hypothetical protein [Datura stramonium]